MIKIYLKYYFLILIALFYSGCSDTMDELSGGYYFSSESSTDQVIVPHGWRQGDAYIPCNVVDYKWNEHYIVAKQIATDECFWPSQNTKFNPINGSKNFWIINAETKKIFGPMDYAAFKATFKSHSIASTLSLSD